MLIKIDQNVTSCNKVATTKAKKLKLIQNKALTSSILTHVRLIRRDYHPD